MKVQAGALLPGMTFQLDHTPELITVLTTRPASHTDPTYRALLDVFHHGYANSPARVWVVNIPRRNLVTLP